MVEIRTGTWARINDDRMFLISVNEERASGLVLDKERAGVYLRKDIPLWEIKSVTRSKRPVGTSRHLVPDRSISFGQIVWDEDKNELHSIRILRDGKVQTVYMPQPQLASVV